MGIAKKGNGLAAELSLAGVVAASVRSGVHCMVLQFSMAWLCSCMIHTTNCKLGDLSQMATTDKVKQHIFFVDDEPDVREAASEILAELDVKVSSFDSAVDCLEHLRSQKVDLLITDVRMPDMDGLELLAKAKRVAPWVRVLIVTGYGDIEMAVKAVKMGALDFIEKPLGMERLLSVVGSALAQSPPLDPLVGKELTRTEMMVLRSICDGNTNKETGRILNRSEKTIEVHRSHIMRKLGVDNVVDLLKRAAAMGLINLS